MFIKNLSEKDVVIESAGGQKRQIKPKEQICFESVNDFFATFYFDDEHSVYYKKRYAVALMNLQAKLNLHLRTDNDTVINLFAKSEDVLEYKITTVDAEIVNSQFYEKYFFVDLSKIDELLEQKEKFDKKQTYKNDFFIASIEAIIPLAVICLFLSVFDFVNIITVLLSVIGCFGFPLVISLLHTHSQNKKKKREIQKDISHICSPDVLQKLFSNPQKGKGRRKRRRWFA